MCCGGGGGGGGGGVTFCRDAVSVFYKQSGLSLISQKNILFLNFSIKPFGYNMLRRIQISKLYQSWIYKNAFIFFLRIVLIYFLLMSIVKWLAVSKLKIKDFLRSEPHVIWSIQKNSR